MPTPQAFLVVGRANWGKSRTIRALTGGKRGWVHLLGGNFFVRRMSNDDPPVTRYEKFIGRLRPARHTLVVAPYCPETRGKAPVLAAWARKYKLRFFVLAENFHGGRRIAAGQVAWLRRHGAVEVFAGAGVPATLRAAALSTDFRGRLGG